MCAAVTNQSSGASALWHSNPAAMGLMAVRPPLTAQSEISRMTSPHDDSGRGCLQHPVDAAAGHAELSKSRPVARAFQVNLKPLWRNRTVQASTTAGS